MDPPGEQDEGFESDGDIIEGMDVLHEEDGGEVLELDGVPDEEEEVVEGLGEMDLENYDETEAEAAAVPTDDASLTFTRHTGSVFCVGVDGSGSLAVTGGEDDLAYVWSIANGDLQFTCTGHKDSVTCASFSHDSVYVATGDMGGLIQVWKVATKELVWSFEATDLEWMTWHPMSHVLLAGTADGNTWMWKIPSGDCKTLQGHGSTCSSGRILPDGKRACIGYEDGAVKLWDLKETKVLHSFTGNQGHSSSVTCIACHPDNNLVFTGSTDMTANLYNTMNDKLLVSLNCDGEQQDSAAEDNSVEAVSFFPQQNLALTGTLQGSLTLWDIPTQKARLQCKHDAGITRLCADGQHVYASTLDGLVHVWDPRSGRVVRAWSGHQAEVLDMTLSRDSSLLLTASEDHTAKVFTLSKPPNS